MCRTVRQHAETQTITYAIIQTPSFPYQLHSAPGITGIPAGSSRPTPEKAACMGARFCPGAVSRGTGSHWQSLCLRCRKNQPAWSDQRRSLHLDAAGRQLSSEQTSLRGWGFSDFLDGLQLLCDLFYALPDGHQKSTDRHSLAVCNGMQTEEAFPRGNRLF